MPLSPGTLLGPYEIVALLGEGGMGVVYRAHDPRLNRDVAIKILRDDAAFSEDRKRRFIQEAKSASALNSANIVHIYDIGQADGLSYIAMEFVQGKTLDRLIGKSGLSLRDTLKYAIQIADALARAHTAGIVHRDLKPSNIVVSDDGTVKLLDFGLAKLTETVPDPGNSATATLQQPEAPLTEEGAIVGTLAYMSPEQAEGKPVDARSDIFSFGAVLYEMATGRRAFQAASRAATLAAVLNSEPQSLAEIAPDLPDDLQKLIARCLRKDPDRRPRHIGDLKLALDDLKDESESGKSFSSAAAARKPSRRSPVLATVAVVAVLLAAGFAFLHWKSAPAPTRSDWVQLTNLPDSVSQPALSPDGRMLAFVRGPNTFMGAGEVYVKMLPSGEPVQLTHDGLPKMGPVFSPDGSRIAYTSVANGMWDTWDVPVLGGQPRQWLPNASGLVWVDPSTLLFSEVKQGMHMGIVTARDNRAGARDIYLPVDHRAMAHRSYASPDRKSVLLVEMNANASFIPCRLVPMDGSSTGRQVGPPRGSCTSAAWSPDGQSMYFTSSAGGVLHIWRQRYPDGDPVQITSGPTAEEGIAMAPDGRSFVTAVGLTQSSVWLHDVSGERQISLEGRASDPEITPDGKRVLYLASAASTSRDLRVVDIQSGRSETVLTGMRADGYKLFSLSPDGTEVVVTLEDSSGNSHLWLAPLDRRSAPRQIPGADGDEPMFGSKGEIFFRKHEGAAMFLYAIRPDGSGLRKVSPDEINEFSGLSPDQQWATVHPVQREMNIGSGVAIPTAGGAPMRIPEMIHRWSGDGRTWFWSSIRFEVTHAVPLPPGQVWARNAQGVVPVTAEETAKLPGIREIPYRAVSPGPTGDVYAFTKTAVQRNLYRIPVP